MGVAYGTDVALLTGSRAGGARNVGNALSAVTVAAKNQTMIKITTSTKIDAAILFSWTSNDPRYIYPVDAVFLFLSCALTLYYQVQRMASRIRDVPFANTIDRKRLIGWLVDRASPTLTGQLRTQRSSQDRPYPRNIERKYSLHKIQVKEQKQRNSQTIKQRKSEIL